MALFTYDASFLLNTGYTGSDSPQLLERLANDSKVVTHSLAILFRSAAGDILRNGHTYKTGRENRIFIKLGVFDSVLFNNHSEMVSGMRNQGTGNEDFVAYFAEMGGGEAYDARIRLKFLLFLQTIKLVEVTFKKPIYLRK